MLLSIVKLALSAPPEILKLLVSPASGSVAVTVVTDVVPSWMLIVVELPPPFDVITGGVFND